MKLALSVFVVAILHVVSVQSVFTAELDESKIPHTNLTPNHIIFQELENSAKLRNVAITSVLRDSNHRLWASTQSGILLHDGQRINSFGTRGAHAYYAPALDVTAIAEDLEGRIWASSSSSGLMKYDESTREFLPVTSTIDHGIEDIFVEESGALIYTSQGSVKAINTSSGRPIEWLPRAWELSGLGQAHKIYGVQGAKRTFVLGSNGLSQISMTDRKILPVGWSALLGALTLHDKHFLENQRIHNIEADDNRPIGFPPDSAIMSKITASSSSAFVFQVYRGLIFVGTDKGLFAFSLDGSFFRKFGTENSRLPGSHITALYGDGDQLWVGTYNGLSKLTVSGFETFGRFHAQPLEDILGFSEDVNGTIWVATYTGLVQFNPESRTIRDAEDVYPNLSIADDRIMAVSSKYNKLWVGTRKSGVTIFDTVKREIIDHDLAFHKEFEVASIKQINEKFTLVGSYSHGLFLFSGKRLSNGFLGFDHLISEPILGIFPTKSSILAIGQTKLFRIHIENRDFEEISLLQRGEAASFTLTAVHYVSEDEILLGTQSHGVMLINIGNSSVEGVSTTPIMSEILQFASAIYAIQEDSSKRIWISTSNGLFLYGTDFGFIRRYSRNDGLQADNFNFSASLLSRNGDLYFGSNVGFTRFDPASIFTAPSSSQVHLGLITSGSRAFRSVKILSETKSITLGHKDRFLNLEFSTRDLTNPGSTRYRHKLEGFDDDWVDVGNRGSATYTNLPAGDYVFRAQALNASGIWNLSGISLDIEVKPAPWLTWWAYTFYALFLLGIGYLLLRIYREQMLKKQALEQAREMQRVADHFADELLDQMDIQRVLTDSIHRYNKELLAWANICIQRSAHYAQGDIEALRGGTDYRLQVLDLVQDALYYRGEELYLDPSAFVGRLFGSAASRYPDLNQRLIAVNDATSELLPATQAIPLAIIIGELFENSMSHGFSQSADACCVRVVVSMPSIREVYLEYQDDGAGIPEGLSFETAEFAGFSIAAEAAKAANGKLEISPDRQTVRGYFSLSGEMDDLDQLP